MRASKLAPLTSEFQERSYPDIVVMVFAALCYPIRRSLHLVSKTDDLAPGFIRRIPEHDPTFRADIGTLARLKQANYDVAAIAPSEPSYRYVSDLTELTDPLEAMLAKNRTPVMAFDAEGTGLVWCKGSTRVILNQFSYRPGESFMAPTHPLYYEKVFNDPNPGAKAEALQGQVKRFLEDERVRKLAHNLKFDHQVSAREGIEVRGWLHDTQLMAFFADENMMSKSLDDCTRVWVPEMAGYADNFNMAIDKSKMMDVPPDDILDADGKVVQYGMRNYAGGDTDACLRLAQRLDKILREDPRQYQCYRRIQMPAIIAFAKVVERYGLSVDKEHLRSLADQVAQYTDAKYDEIVRLIPPALRRDYLRRGEEISFTRDVVMRDILFGKKGFGLTPKVFTKSTAKLPPAQRVPSVSTKDHMPYFEDAPGNAGRFVTGYIDFLKQQKLITTYIGSEEKQSGFWQYIAPDGAIYPSYKLHATVTGRSASDNPNGQNFPKRGRFAKSYNKVFKARPGYKLVSADLSQIELRIAAWMANEPEMLRIYRADGDIHASTGAATAGWTDEFFAQHKNSDAILADVVQDFYGAQEYLAPLVAGECNSATVAKYLKPQRQKGEPVTRPPFTILPSTV
ncbi:DNA polymerase [Aurantimonas manganoxydans]|nr:DNA polymerase [Aurantimonas manganoxydans]